MMKLQPHGARVEHVLSLFVADAVRLQHLHAETKTANIQETP